MTDPSHRANLIPLSETDQTIADPDLDVRDREVVAADQEKIGTVEDIIVDDEEWRARFLRVGSGGLLGVGKEHFLVPVDVVTGIDDERVHIDRARAGLSDVPGYDPEVTEEPDYYENVYGWWDLTPYWGPGYSYPKTPPRR